MKPWTGNIAEVRTEVSKKADPTQEPVSWTENELKRLDELKSLGTPRPLAEEMVRFQRLGIKPPPRPNTPCLKTKEYDKYPNLSEDKLKHVEECLVCKTIIHCRPYLKKLPVQKKTNLLQKIRN